MAKVINMKASVIIPVYNAVQYVTQAVESPLAQPKTAEVKIDSKPSPEPELIL
jgi:GT2 family glycosyltransferase